MHSRIASNLLRVVFTLYLLVSFTVTIIQIYLEFSNERDVVGLEIARLNEVVSPALGAALWDFDSSQRQFAVEGIVKNPAITGVAIFDMGEETVHTMGDTPERLSMTTNRGEGVDFAGFNSYTYSLYYSQDGRRQEVGQVVYFSTFGVVFDRVKYTLYLTVVNAVVKTLALWLIFYFIVRKFVGLPLQRLTSQIDQYRLERTQQDNVKNEIVKISKENELIILQKSFVRMAAELTEHDATIREYNQELEKLVDERTSEIKNINRRLNQALLNAEQNKLSAQAANYSKSLFLASMSHEIRTPLNGIVGYTSMVLAEELAGETRDNMETIAQCSESLLTLVNDVLDLAKIEAEKIDLENIPLDIEELVYQAFELVRNRLHSDQIELIVDNQLQSNLLKGDPTRLRQVFLNLLSNAAKFTQAGHIILRFEQKSIDEYTLGFICSVLDTGVGMSQSIVTNIFEAYTQAEQSTSRKFGGTGLGLNICKQLIERMGGELTVASQLGEGSTFSFTLTLGRQKIGVQNNLTERKENVTAHILVVERHQLANEVLCRYLSAHGATVKSCDNCREAAELIADFSPQLIFIANNPEDSHLELFLDQVREGNRSSNSTCIALMHHCTPELWHRCHVIGFDDYLIKPIHPKRIDRILKETFCPRDNQLKSEHKKLLAKRPRHSFSFLLVEDDLINQKLQAEILHKMGHKVVVVAGGEEAIERTRSQNFDLIFMDVELANLDGIEVTRKLRRNGVEAPIVAMTANAFKSDRDRCIAAGMNSFLAKPINSSAVEEVIRLYCGGSDSGSGIRLRMLFAELDGQQGLARHRLDLQEEFPLAKCRVADSAFGAMLLLGGLRPHILFVEATKQLGVCEQLLSELKADSTYDGVTVVVITELSESELFSEGLLEVRNSIVMPADVSTQTLVELVNELTKAIAV